ncbi:MAG: VWA domain-containing protein [Thermoanaerobaculia bacterium]
MKLVLLTLLALPTAAQFTETLEVRVLEIEATVVDRNQNTIEGLTREDFVVTIDGRPAAITNFSAVSRGVVRESVAAIEHEAVVAMPVPTRLIIVIDDLSLHQEPKQRALRALRTYVDETMDASTTAMLITWNGALTTRTTPTTRREILRSAIAASAREIPRGMAVDTERRQVDAMRGLASYGAMAESYARSRAVDAKRTLEALGEIVAGAASAVEGRKLVLFISEGVPIHPGAELSALLPAASASRLLSPEISQAPRFRAFAKQAQAAGVVFSTVDPSTAVDGFEREGVSWLARETGGTVVASNDLERELIRLDERLSTFYSIAVHPPANTEGNPPIEVRVKDRPKLRVHVATRRGLPSRDEAIANAVRAQLTWRNEENPLNARLFVEVEQHERGCIASLQFLVPAEGLTLLEPSSPTRGQLDFWFAVADPRGIESPVKMQSVIVTSRHGATIGHAMPLALASAEYVVSTAVVDRLSGATSFLQREMDCGR